MATAKRTDLAALLVTLTPEQWQTQSLCEQWRVRDVVAHVMSFDGASLLGMVRRAVRGRIVHINQVGVDDLASLSTGQLLDRLEAHLRPQGLAASFGGRLALLDVTIHHQDIRRPLGLPRQIPADRLRRSWMMLYVALSCRVGGPLVGCGWSRPIWIGVMAPGRRFSGLRKLC